jgi:FixJ family two-component response regulator
MGKDSKDSIIAVIDDDPAVREATGGLLRSLGYAVILFGSAEEFLNSHLRYRMSCIVSDVRMPGMSGLSLLVRLASYNNNIPLILMTAFPENTCRERVMAGGAHDFLIKPVPEDDLIRSVASAVARNP